MLQMGDLNYTMLRGPASGCWALETRLARWALVKYRNAGCERSALLTSKTHERDKALASTISKGIAAADLP